MEKKLLEVTIKFTVTIDNLNRIIKKVQENCVVEITDIEVVRSEDGEWLEAEMTDIEKSE